MPNMYLTSGELQPRVIGSTKPQIDPETGLDRTVFFTKALRQKFVDAFTERRTALESLFLKFDYPALFIESDFSPDIISNYFEHYMSV